jgi:hypothetical protein
VLRVGQVLEGLEGGPLGRLVALLDHVEVLAGAEHGGRVLLQKARDLVQPETTESVRVNTPDFNYLPVLSTVDAYFCKKHGILSSLKQPCQLGLKPQISISFSQGVHY